MEHFYYIKYSQMGAWLMPEFTQSRAHFLLASIKFKLAEKVQLKSQCFSENNRI